ncbi:MAG: outer membrane lipoprotein-sorting protein [Proteobacteria bacterium]|nr:outer membrane lipoprotein-sorting protein [Pseudomonadota bacterium]
MRGRNFRASIPSALLCLSAFAAFPAHAVAPATLNLPSLSVEQIVSRNLQARGGATAWKALSTIAWKGEMGAGASSYEAVTAKGTLERRTRAEKQLPFSFEFKRPNKSRLELQFNGQTAVQVFDGSHGYKYRPFMNRTDWEAYSAAELAQASAEPGVDGYLIDYAAKGRKVELEGRDSVENQAAYKLKVTLPGGQVRHVWVDGRTFLETKIEGAPRKLDNTLHPVALYLRDYKPEQGLMVPHTLETAVQGVAQTEKISIESVAVNKGLDDARFTKPK